MALEPAQFLHPLDGGGTGEFKESYADPPTGYASWTLAIQALIDAAPFESEAKNRAWVYVQLYGVTTQAGELGVAASGFTESYELGDFQVSEGETPSTVDAVDTTSFYSYWRNTLARLCKVPTRPYVSTEVTK